MEATLAVLADFASVTADCKLNILGVFDEVNPSSLPLVLPQFYLVISYTASPADVGAQRTARIALLTSDGKELLSLVRPIVVPSPTRPGTRAKFNQIIGLAGMCIEQPGDYQFSVLIDDDEKASVTLHVNETRESIEFLTAEEYPVLAELWNNDDDALFDSL